MRDSTLTVEDRNKVFVSRYAKWHLQLLRFVLTLVPDRDQAEDIVQETARVLWQKFEEYDPEQPFWPWARRFAYFETLRHRKKHARARRYFSDELVETLAEERINQEDFLEERRRALQMCLDKLVEKDRRLVIERYENNTSVTEMAQKQQKSANALSLALHRIRQKLVECTSRQLRAER